MKEGILLLLTGLLCAGAAALFFRLFGNDALNIIFLLTMIAALADNARLRRRLRALGAKPQGKRTWL